ncbi:hypothetical protein HK105_207185 [Polyrhizophydium stewartii]|uniref:Uncharacterized protein n=1 Tax=Polyrhizophydium stewartii TaxID=2732419 RepID=A0ABR4N1B8_9FUNG
MARPLSDPSGAGGPISSLSRTIASINGCPLLLQSNFGVFGSTQEPSFADTGLAFESPFDKLWEKNSDDNKSLFERFEYVAAAALSGNGCVESDHEDDDDDNSDFEQSIDAFDDLTDQQHAERQKKLDEPFKPFDFERSKDEFDPDPPTYVEVVAGFVTAIGTRDLPTLESLEFLGASRGHASQST